MSYESHIRCCGVSSDKTSRLAVPKGSTCSSHPRVKFVEGACGRLSPSMFQAFSEPLLVWLKELKDQRETVALTCKFNFLWLATPSRSAPLSRPAALSAGGVSWQSLGASDANDTDGEMVASLVNKAALDTIAKVCTWWLFDELKFY